MEQLGRQHLQIIHTRTEKELHALSVEKEAITHDLQEVRGEHAKIVTTLQTTQNRLEREVQLLRGAEARLAREFKQSMRIDQLNKSHLETFGLITRILRLWTDSNLSDERKQELSVDIPHIILEREILRSDCSRLERELAELRERSDHSTDFENVD